MHGGRIVAIVFPTKKLIDPRLRKGLMRGDAIARYLSDGGDLVRQDPFLGGWFDDAPRDQGGNDYRAAEAERDFEERKCDQYPHDAGECCGFAVPKAVGDADPQQEPDRGSPAPSGRREKDKVSAAASLRKSGGASVSLTILKESAIGIEAASPQDRSNNMTEPDVLSRDIDALKALQRDAWRELASPSLTMFDRREIRNRIRQSETELRNNLKMMSERLRYRPRPVEVVGDSVPKLDFRFL